MHSHLEAVKHHLTETLLAKARARDSLFNIVEFSYKVTKWCDRMVTCYMDTVYGALGWVRSLCCKPGRDLLGALQAAFDDPACQAVYLVTNGLPQSNPEEVLHAVSSVSQQRPVHVFCLADKWTGSEGQDFLRALAQCTRGSCHLVTLNTADLTQVTRSVFNIGSTGCQLRKQAHFVF
ncbi:VWA3B protein, partial [Amia calva]|nr:VWA3B protein [Amia calva]